MSSTPAFVSPLPSLFVHSSSRSPSISHHAATVPRKRRGRLPSTSVSCHSLSTSWKNVHSNPSCCKTCLLEKPRTTITSLVTHSPCKNRPRTIRCAKKMKRLRTDFSPSIMKSKISRAEVLLFSNSSRVSPIYSMASPESVEQWDDHGSVEESAIKSHWASLSDMTSTEVESRLSTDAKSIGITAESRAGSNGVGNIDNTGADAISSKRTAQNTDSLNSDSIRWYLQVIGEDRLLRAEEEIELGRLIRCLMSWEATRSDLSATIGRTASDDELADFLSIDRNRFTDMLRDARRAKDRMIVCNLRLVVSIAKRYINRGLPLTDLIQEGTLGLIRACEKFDADKGFKFSTYATWWVRQAVSRSIADQSRTIRLPVHLYDTISAIRKATKFLTVELGRAPHEPELAEYCNITVEKIRMARVSMQHSVPLDCPLSAQEDAPMLSDIIESNGDSPEDLVDWSLLRDDLEHVVNSLTPRERDVVRMRYGLDDGRAKTLEEIGKAFDVSKERVRQIESRALRKLRHPFRADVLRQYASREW